MIVEDLIKELQQLNPKALAVTQSSNFELGGELVELKLVYPSKGKIVQKACVDAFDGTRYETPIIRSVTDADLDIIVIGG